MPIRTVNAAPFWSLKLSKISVTSMAKAMMRLAWSTLGTTKPQVASTPLSCMLRTCSTPCRSAAPSNAPTRALRVVTDSPAGSDRAKSSNPSNWA